ncbi:hypothetical protein GH714_004453 [Hevea brasiliensis]|uniref:Uncharacterized protein n=1 Tax=Hevea brasiliensis TaxID=3981 RepID=A0A6A6LIB5_HEVBR|nr:hypothetical protein GH714_004453 [Hevea brasiliensis]
MEGLQWRIGNATTVRIWGDRWLPKQPGRLILSPIQGLDQGSTVDALMTDGRWNRQLINSIFNPDQAQQILELPLNHRNPVNVLFWNGTRNGANILADAIANYAVLVQNQEMVWIEELLPDLDLVASSDVTLVFAPNDIFSLFL